MPGYEIEFTRSEKEKDVEHVFTKYHDGDGIG